MILYPTETIYALGVNAFDNDAVDRLTRLKGRGGEKFMSVLVRDIEDIDRWAELSTTARAIAEQFLPGPLTLVLPSKLTNGLRVAPDGFLRFRMSPDPVAQQTIADFMSEHDAPLTCTSANLSGLEPQPTVPDILAQLGERADQLEQIIDDGPRSGLPSTVVRVVGDEITIHREGAIPTDAVFQVGHRKA